MHSRASELLRPNQSEHQVAHHDDCHHELRRLVAAALEKAGFTVNGKINRKDWGLNWNAALEAGGLLVGEEVKINCDIQLAKKV